MQNTRWLVVSSLCLLVAPAVLRAELSYANPGDSLETLINALAPGDTLVLTAGTYTNADEHISDLHGTEAQPITIMGEDAGMVVVTGDYSHNAFDFINCSYIVFKDMEIHTASNAIKLNNGATSHYMTFENLKLHDFAGVAISGPGAGNSHITIRGVEIYDTGMISSYTGEGIYLSYYNAPVDNLIIENCWIHDLHGVETDGLELKYPRNTIIRNNVISTENFPCIKCLSANDGTKINIIEGNVVYGNNATGIEVYGDAYVYNNICFNLETGLYSRDDSGNTGYPLRNVHFINNTVYNCSNQCIALNGWSGKSNLVVANNALYQPNSGMQAIYIGPSAPLGGVTVENNYYYGTYYNNDAPQDGWIPAGLPTDAMLDPANHVFYPTADSELLDAATGSLAADKDFNANSRPFNSVDDVGAYEWSQATNPGWTIGAGFNPTNSTTPLPPSGGGGSSDSGSGCALHSSFSSFSGGAGVCILLVLLLGARAVKSRIGIVVLRIARRQHADGLG